MCVVSEEAAVKPLCDTLIMTCQTGDMAAPNSLKWDTHVRCQSLTHHLYLSHMDTNTQTRGPKTILNMCLRVWPTCDYCAYKYRAGDIIRVSYSLLEFHTQIRGLLFFNVLFITIKAGVCYCALAPVSKNELGFKVFTH